MSVRGKSSCLLLQVVHGFLAGDIREHLWIFHSPIYCPLPFIPLQELVMLPPDDEEPGQESPEEEVTKQCVPAGTARDDRCAATW